MKSNSNLGFGRPEMRTENPTCARDMRQTFNCLHMKQNANLAKLYSFQVNDKS